MVGGKPSNPKRSGWVGNLMTSFGGDTSGQVWTRGVGKPRAMRVVVVVVVAGVVVVVVVVVLVGVGVGVGVVVVVVVK